MTIDHFGMLFYPQATWLRAIGRISYPIFAFMLAQGSMFTRHKLKYFMQIFLLGILCQTVSVLALNDYHQNVLITLSLALLFCYISLWLKNSVKTQNTRQIILASCVAIIYLSLMYYLCYYLGKTINNPQFAIDYGLIGIVLPSTLLFADNKWLNFASFSLGLILLSLSSVAVQWFCLLALPLLLCYSGKRGQAQLKYLFYIYYPLHLAVLYALLYLKLFIW